MSNSLTTIHGTPGDAVNGLTAVERYLSTTYLKDRTFETVLANTAYASSKNLPKRSGQFAKFTRRKPLRLPEVSAEGTDPLSGSTLSYEQMQVPIEEVADFVEITKFAGATAWMDLANDARLEIRKSLRRYLHYAVQGAFHVGRYLPGYRDANGATPGGQYPPFWTTAEATPTLYGTAFTMFDAPKYYTGRVGDVPTNAPITTYDGLLSNTSVIGNHRMVDYIDASVRLSNAGAPKIKGGYVACVSDGVINELFKDDDYFAAAIRNQSKSDMLFDNMLATYRGIHWVRDDEPMTLAANTANQSGADATGIARATWGYNHVSQMFGQDAFGYLRMGGMNAAQGAKFKVQDITKTGSSYTIGYRVPFQAMILNPAWCCEIIGPVSVNDQNNSGSMIT